MNVDGAKNWRCRPGPSTLVRMTVQFGSRPFRSERTVDFKDRPLSLIRTVYLRPYVRFRIWFLEVYLIKFDNVKFRFLFDLHPKKAQMREDWLRESTKLLETDNFGSDLAAVEAAQKVANLSNLISCNQKQEGLGTSD